MASPKVGHALSVSIFGASDPISQKIQKLPAVALAKAGQTVYIFDDEPLVRFFLKIIHDVTKPTFCEIVSNVQ